PQPSLIEPQFLPWAAQVVGVQAGAPQTLAVPPPPQVWGEVQEPQLRVPPQPSLIEPQFLPWAEHVVGVQVEPPDVMRSTGALAPSLELKVTPWLVLPPALAERTNVATPSVSAATLLVTSYSIQVPALALLTLIVASAPVVGVLPGAGAVFQVSPVSLQE